MTFELMNGWGAGASGALALVAAYWGTPLVSRARAVRELVRACRRSRTIVLTYDDGPGVELTPAVHEMLSEHGAKATFFVLGRRVPGCEPILDRTVALGHEIGCHGQSHHNAWKSLPWVALRDIDEGFGTLSRWSKKDVVFRPPHGKLTLVTWLALAARKTPIGWWTVDSGDTFDVLPEPRAAIERVVRDSGGVVLLHDFDRSRERMDYVLRTTELLLQASKREGLRIVRMRDLLAELVHPT
jgi:peptidoglycan/xylan/chitin deacetylase (PgdA/CDA1 family)